MRKIFLLIMTFTFSYSLAQINNDLLIEHLELMAEDSGEEVNDYSELIETYWSITENPININSDDIDQLAELKLISIFQLEDIRNYRNDFGDFLFIEELYEVESLDERSIEMIKPIICFESKKDRFRIRNLKYGKNKILIEANQCLNKKQGYSKIADSLLYEKPNSTYLGSPQKLYLRYNYTYKNKIEAGFVLEKDPGEYIFKTNLNDSIIKLLGDRCYSGFDFFSLHFHIREIYFVKDLAIGDYKLSLGQGLTMGSGIAFNAQGGSLLRRNKKIVASKSANEAYYLRGVASTFQFKNFELTTFYSNKRNDANVTSYENNKPLKISSLQQNGLHRTYNEILDRKVIRQQLYGLNLSYRISNFQIGYTLHKTDLSAYLQPDNNIYNLFYFRGRSLTNQGIDFYYITNKTLFYGEIAMSNNNAFAGLIGTTIQPTGYIEFSILYRNYAKDYQCLYSNAFASGNNTRNEKGWYFSSAISLASNWKLITNVDFYKSDWFKNNAHSPSHGLEFDTQLNYQANNNTLMFIEFRNKHKMKNTSNSEIFQRYLINEENNMVRFHVSYDLFDILTLKNRIEYHFNNYEDGKYNSYLIYQDIIYNPPNNIYNFSFRYELFNAEKGNVYAYENDVLYTFAVGGLSGKGIRTYLVGKIKPIDKLQISGKIGFTFYDDKNEIGTGLEIIKGNCRSDAKLQFIWNI